MQVVRVIFCGCEWCVVPAELQSVQQLAVSAGWLGCRLAWAQQTLSGSAVILRPAHRAHILYSHCDTDMEPLENKVSGEETRAPSIPTHPISKYGTGETLYFGNTQHTVHFLII